MPTAHEFDPTASGSGGRFGCRSAALGVANRGEPAQRTIDGILFGVHPVRCDRQAMAACGILRGPDNSSARMIPALLRTAPIVFSVAVLSACGLTEPDPEGRLRSVMSIAEGDCLNDASSEDAIASSEDGEGSVFDVRQLDCSRPHAYEVYRIHRASEGRYPGREALEALADKVCESGFQSFVGRAYEDSDLDFHVLWPSEDGWNDERDREIVCLLASMDDTLLTGSMRGSKR